MPVGSRLHDRPSRLTLPESKQGELESPPVNAPFLISERTLARPDAHTV